MTPLFYCLRRDYFYQRPSSNAEQFQIVLNNHEEGNKILKYLVESGADINWMSPEMSICQVCYY
jgi:hypothetical protein